MVIDKCNTKTHLEKKYVEMFFSWVYDSKNRSTWTLKCYKGENLNDKFLIYEVKETNPLMGELKQIRLMDKFLTKNKNLWNK